MTTTVITSAKLRENMAEALNSVSSGGVLIVKRRGKPDVAVVDTDVLEDFLTSQNPRFIKKIAKARRSTKTYSFEEVFGDSL